MHQNTLHSVPSCKRQLVDMATGKKHKLVKIDMVKKQTSFLFWLVKILRITNGKFLKWNLKSKSIKSIRLLNISMVFESISQQQ